MVPIKNRDLWQRLDRALAFHKLETRRVFRIDAAHESREATDLSTSQIEPPTTTSHDAAVVAPPDGADGAECAGPRWRHAWRRMRRRVRDRVDGLAISCAQLGSPIANTPWAN